MGIYDSVVVACTQDNCNGVIEFQSKAGKCQLSTFSINEVPLAIAESINGEIENCPKCGKSHSLLIPLTQPRVIAMKVTVV